MKQRTNNQKIKIFTLPNVLSVLRILLIPIIVWLYCVEKNYLWAGIMLILSGVTDMVDGFIARRFKMVSDLGKVLDPIADKLTQAAMLVCLITRFPLMLLPFVLLILKETFMSISGLLVIQKTGHVMSAVWHGKVATALLYATMILHIFWFDIHPIVSNVLILLSAAMIIVSFVLYGIHNVVAIKNATHDPKNKESK